MRFAETKLPGVVLVEIDAIRDFRGFFARTWCAREFSDHGLMSVLVQTSIAFNEKKNTLRGLHFQAPPRREGRLVRCVNGSAFVAVVDLRPTQATFLQHITVELTDANRKAIIVPPGRALGYQTLQDRTEIMYHMDEYYDPNAARGVRWNDSAFDIKWPDGERIILDRDNEYPDFDLALVEGFIGYV